MYRWIGMLLCYYSYLWAQIQVIYCNTRMGNMEQFGEKMKFIYIFHSGFVFETEQSILTVDYSKNPANVIGHPTHVGCI